MPPRFLCVSGDRQFAGGGADTAFLPLGTLSWAKLARLAVIAQHDPKRGQFIPLRHGQVGAVQTRVLLASLSDQRLPASPFPIAPLHHGFFCTEDINRNNVVSYLPNAQSKPSHAPFGKRFKYRGARLLIQSTIKEARPILRRFLRTFNDYRCANWI